MNNDLQKSLEVFTQAFANLVDLIRGVFNTFDQAAIEHDLDIDSYRTYVMAINEYVDVHNLDEDEYEELIAPWSDRVQKICGLR